MQLKRDSKEPEGTALAELRELKNISACATSSKNKLKIPTLRDIVIADYIIKKNKEGIIYGNRT